MRGERRPGAFEAEHRLDDPEYIELIRRSWEALSWDPDDPRLDELASALADNLLTNRTLMEAQAADFFSTPGATTRYRLSNHHREDQAAPALARLTALIEAKLRAAGLDVP
ncbi:hypothetical protein AB0G35_34810 [Streptomyces sp. NPDC021749]|uniref:Transcriptional regulator n=1 Tax=Streptomyces siderophoricus TaxID=2802281 RepID=A0ABS1MYV5_9ACTN|nr:hypothetical protein [Streptomyces sp. 9-7]MBL1092974.1 hypothetical protein [Streptomyces sp. 9-7]